MQSTQRKSWSNRPSSSETRLRGRALQQARAELFRRNPLCVNCQKKGITRLATERDHIINLAEGGTDDPGNTQGLCVDCHKAKTQRESNKARGITSRPRMSTGCDVRGYPLGEHHWNE
jgi:5-methylcytosine-specific restriction enzyme A